MEGVAREDVKLHLTFTSTHQGWNAAKVYKVLSLAYLKQPERSYLSTLSEWSGKLLANSDGLPDGIIEALRLINGCLRHEIDGETVLQIQQEYVRLIRSPSPLNSPPPPYESVYLEGTLWGSSTVEILKKYHAFGLELTDGFSHEPPDHVGLELQFMGFLCESEPQPLGIGMQTLLKAQLDFLSEHLCKWFPLFQERALQYEPHQFYEGIIKLTHEWLNLHLEHLSVCLC